jgi:TPR repeat protein
VGFAGECYIDYYENDKIQSIIRAFSNINFISMSLATEWYRKAAEQGHNGAQLHLGIRYSNGDGIHMDYKVEAVKWFKLSSEGGLD